MAFPSALTTQQQTNIEAPGYTCSPLVLVDPNDIIFQATINQASFETVFVSLTFDNVTIGSITNVLDGYTVFIGSETNLKEIPDARIFRSRGNQSAGTTLNINETSASLQDNMLIRVVRDVRTTEKLGVIDPDTGALLLDYNQTYTAPRPICNDTGGFTRAARIQGSGQSVNFSLTPVGQAVASGATISSYAWFVNGLQIISGSISTQNITLRATAPGWYFPRLTITDSNGVTNWFQYILVVVDYAYQNTIPANNIRISGDTEDGWNAGFDGYDTEDDAPLKLVPDNTNCIIYTEETFNSFLTNTSLISSVRFTGRFRTETASVTSDARNGALAQSQYVVEGIGLQLGRLPSPEVTLSFVSSPTQNGEINNLTIWRSVAWLMVSFYTVANACPVLFGDTSNTYLVATQESDASGGLDSLNTILSSINAYVAFDPQGGIRIERDLRYEDETGRNAATTVANFRYGTYYNYQIVNEQGVIAGRSFAFGASYSSITGEYTYVRATAPAVAPGRGIGKPQLDGQILEADVSLEAMQSEIALRGANKLALENPHPRLSGAFVDAYHGIVMPSLFQWYTHTIPANINTFGIAYTTSQRWLCISVDISFNDDGTVDFDPSFEIETDSSDAQVSTEIAPGQTFPPIVGLPPAPPAVGVVPVPGIGYTDPNPDPEDTPPDNQEETDQINDPTQPEPGQETDEPTAVTKGGNAVACTNPGGVFITTNFTKSSNPLWRDRSPASSGIGAIGLAWWGGRAVVLQDNDEDTTAWRYDNLWGNAPAQGYTFLDESYGIVKFEDGASEVMIYSPNTTGAWCVDHDFTTGSEFGWVVGGSDGERGVWTGSGYASTTGVTPPADESHQVEIRRSFTDTNITSITVYYDFTSGQNPTSPNNNTLIQWLLSSVGVSTATKNSTTAAGQDFDGAPNTTIDEIRIRIRSSFDNVSPPPSPTGSVFISRVEICGTGASPFGGTSAAARRSTDGGASWGAAQTVGDAVQNATGFDTQKIGTLMLGVGNNRVRQSTSNGAYSDEANGEPTAGQVRAVYFYGKSAVSYIFGQDTLGGDNDSVFKVTGGARTNITPYDGSNYGIVVAGEPIAVSNSNHNLIYLLCSFGSVKKLCKSTNGGTSWAIITGFSTDAYGVDINPYNNAQVIVSDNDTIWYSPDNGVTFYPKQSPGDIYQAWFRR